MRPQCPVGVNTCELLDEVGQLRERVDELSMLVSTDELTGVYNYRHLLWTLGQELERVRRHGGSFAVLMIDFDNFKQLNDNHGHEFANQVLKNVGSFFLRSLRKLDVPCRFGGDEFVIVVPGGSLREAVLLAERLRDGIVQMNLEAEDKPVALTVSIGVECFGPSDYVTPDQVLHRADRYLLRAKQAGKNTVCFEDVVEQDTAMSADEKSAVMDSFGRSGN